MAAEIVAGSQVHRGVAGRGQPWNRPVPVGVHPGADRQQGCVQRKPVGGLPIGVQAVFVLRPPQQFLPGHLVGRLRVRVVQPKGQCPRRPISHEAFDSVRHGSADVQVGRGVRIDEILDVIVKIRDAEDQLIARQGLFDSEVPPQAGFGPKIGIRNPLAFSAGAWNEPGDDSEALSHPAGQHQGETAQMIGSAGRRSKTVKSPIFGRAWGGKTEPGKNVRKLLF